MIKFVTSALLLACTVRLRPCNCHALVKQVPCHVAHLLPSENICLMLLRRPRVQLLHASFLVHSTCILLALCPRSSSTILNMVQQRYVLMSCCILQAQARSYSHFDGERDEIVHGARRLNTFGSWLNTAYKKYDGQSSSKKVWKWPKKDKSPPPASPSPSPSPPDEKCKRDKDCPKGTWCQGGKCLPMASPSPSPPVDDECKRDKDCPKGEWCQDGKCEPMPSPSPAPSPAPCGDKDWPCCAPDGPEGGECTKVSPRTAALRLLLDQSARDLCPASACDPPMRNELQVRFIADFNLDCALGWCKPQDALPHLLGQHAFLTAQRICRAKTAKCWSATTAASASWRSPPRPARRRR